MDSWIPVQWKLVINGTHLEANFVTCPIKTISLFAFIQKLVFRTDSGQCNTMVFEL